VAHVRQKLRFGAIGLLGLRRPCYELLVGRLQLFVQRLHLAGLHFELGRLILQLLVGELELGALALQLLIVSLQRVGELRLPRRGPGQNRIEQEREQGRDEAADNDDPEDDSRVARLRVLSQCQQSPLFSLELRRQRAGRVHRRLPRVHVKHQASGAVQADRATPSDPRIERGQTARRESVEGVQPALLHPVVGRELPQHRKMPLDVGASADVRLEKSRVAGHEVAAFPRLGVDEAAQDPLRLLDDVVRVRHPRGALVLPAHTGIRQPPDDQDDQGRRDRQRRVPGAHRWRQPQAFLGSRQRFGSQIVRSATKCVSSARACSARAEATGKARCPIDHGQATRRSSCHTPV
jgi:hypothetical protein